MNRTAGMFVAMVGALAALPGCENDQQEAMEAERDLAETRRETARDVAEARQEARQDVNEARQGAADDVNEARRDAIGDSNRAEANQAVAEVRREAAQELTEAQREANANLTDAQREANQKVAEAQRDAQEARREAAGTATSLGDRIAAVVVQREGMGSIRGRVMLSGSMTPPAVPLARAPGCDGMPATDHNLVVNTNRTLRNVIVRIAGDVPGTVDVPSSTLEIEQDDCMFSPRVAAVVAGQTIEVERSNGELVVPTTRGTGPFTRAQLGATPVEAQVSPFGGLLTFRDPARAWMRAYVMVLNHDHFAVTDDSGTFTLANIPPGTYSVESWQEQLGRKSSRVTVRPDQIADVEMSYSGTETGGFADAR